MAVGQKVWAIAEGYIPSQSVSEARELVSHEAACILNAGTTAADTELMIYFEDREPVGPYRFKVEAGRTLHMRFNDLKDPQPIPRDTAYASILRSNVPIVVQHTRLDSRHPNIALISTIAFPVPS
jgi:hypothetical protein